MASTFARAVAFSKHLIAAGAGDWQEVQEALADHDEFGLWLAGDVALSVAVIRSAENALGSALPASYAD